MNVLLNAERTVLEFEGKPWTLRYVKPVDGVVIQGRFAPLEALPVEAREQFEAVTAEITT